MHISKFLDTLLRRPHVEIIETSLPERRGCQSLSQEIALAGVLTFFLRQQGTCGPLLQHLHYCRWISSLRFADEQVNMLWHDYVSHDDEAIPLPCLFQYREESVTAAHRAQERRSPVAGASDKVQVVSAVSAMQAGRHDTHSTGVVATRPCKERKDGAPVSESGKKNSGKLGHPPQNAFCRSRAVKSTFVKVFGLASDIVGSTIACFINRLRHSDQPECFCNARDIRTTFHH